MIPTVKRPRSWRGDGIEDGNMLCIIELLVGHSKGIPLLHRVSRSRSKEIMFEWSITDEQAMDIRRLYSDTCRSFFVECNGRVLSDSCVQLLREIDKTEDYKSMVLEVEYISSIPENSMYSGLLIFNQVNFFINRLANLILRKQIERD